MIFNDGTYCDLTALSDGRVILAYSTPTGELVFKLTDGRDYLRRGYRKWLLHLRAAGSTNGHIIAVGQDHETGQALFSVDAGSLTSLGVCSGVSPVECIPSRDGWEVYVLRPRGYDVYYVNQYGTYEHEGSGPLQDIARVIDEAPSHTRGYTFLNYDLPGPYIINPSGRTIEVLPGSAKTPCLHYQEGSLWGAAWTNRGVWLEEIKDENQS
jgi:hypothetical protein